MQEQDLILELVHKDCHQDLEDCHLVLVWEECLQVLEEWEEWVECHLDSEEWEEWEEECQILK